MPFDWTRNIQLPLEFPRPIDRLHRLTTSLLISFATALVKTTSYSSLKHKRVPLHPKTGKPCLSCARYSIEPLFPFKERNLFRRKLRHNINPKTQTPFPTIRVYLEVKSFKAKHTLPMFPWKVRNTRPGMYIYVFAFINVFLSANDLTRRRCFA